MKLEQMEHKWKTGPRLVQVGAGTEDLVTHEDDDFYDEDEPYCYRCDNTGWILVCIDDMCRGSGECIHGDGMRLCPVCKGRNAA